MPIARFQLEDGRIARFEVPDGTTPDQAHEMMQAHFSGQSDPIKPAQPTDEQSARASTLGRFAAGMAEPLVGAGQLLAHGISAISPKGSYGEDLAGIVDSYWKDQNNQQEQAKKAANVGTDVAGFAGNLLSPANALLAAKGVTAATALGRVAQGAMLGAGGAAMQPVLGNGDYGSTKAGQVALGAAAGGAMTKLIDAVAGNAAARLARKVRPEDAQTLGARASQYTDDAVNHALKETGIDASSMPPEQLQAIRDQVINGIKNGKELDAAALLRKQDFDSLGMSPLQGQITRDPLQFAQERNLRAVPEVAQRLDTLGQQLRGKISAVADGASDPYDSGNALIAGLRKYHDAKQAELSNLYGSARAESGRFADVNVPQFSQMANAKLDEAMLGHYLPTETKNLLNDISTGKIPLNVNNLVQVDSVLSAAQRKAAVSGDNAAAKAVGVVRDALNSADIVDESGLAAKQAFDVARGAARSHFATLDAIPALKAVASGDAVPDTFAQKFIVGNRNTNEVKRLAELLKSESPEMFSEAKRQIGATLERAAFGENGAADSAFSPDRFAKALRTMGKDKLGSFFSTDEIDGLNRMARVGAYINKVPDVAPVNHSNTLTAALMNGPLLGMASHIPGYGAAIGAAKAMTGAVKNQMAAANAMNAEVPSAAAKLTPQQARLVALLRAAGAVGGGVGGAQLAE